MPVDPDGIDLERVLVENNQVRELACFQRALGRLFATLVSGIEVMAFNASNGVVRWSGPITSPPRDTRLTADQTMNIRSSGATSARAPTATM